MRQRPTVAEVAGAGACGRAAGCGRLVARTDGFQAGWTVRSGGGAAVSVCSQGRVDAAPVETDRAPGGGGPIDCQMDSGMEAGEGAAGMGSAGCSTAGSGAGACSGDGGSVPFVSFVSFLALGCCSEESGSAEPASAITGSGAGPADVSDAAAEPEVEPWAATPLPAS
jgi:hypothetical protein